MSKQVPIFIRTKDVQQILCCGSTTAQKRLSTLKAILQKQTHQRVTLKEFCDYEGVAIQDVIKQFYT